MRAERTIAFQPAIASLIMAMGWGKPALAQPVGGGRGKAMDKKSAQIQMIRDADLIMGVDGDFGNRFILFGRELLQQIRDDEAQPGKLYVVQCEIDANHNKLEDVLETVASVRGHHDFKPEADELDAWADEYLHSIEQGHPPHEEF